MKFLRKLLKTIKLLFSRYILIILLILLQIIVIQILLVFVQATYWWVNLIVYGLDILLFFHIMNKKEAPEFKIPWIVLFLVFPITGIICWVFFSNHGLRRRHNKLIRKIDNSVKPYLSFNDLNNEDLGYATRNFNYLMNQTNYKYYKNCRVTYFESGEKYFDSIIEDLKKAKEFIFIEFFIINRGIIWDRVHAVLKEKAKEGVEIRILFDDIGSAGNMNHIYMNRLRKEGMKVEAFNKATPILSGIYNNRDHRKIVVIDHLAAYTGGNNLADEYANLEERFGHWKDTGVKVEGEAINSFIGLFLQLYDLETKSVSDYDKLLNYKYEKFEEEGYVMPFGDGPKPFFKELIGEGNFLNMINGAKKSIMISSPYLIPTHSLVSAIRNAALRGVLVKIMLPGIPDKKIPYGLAKSYFKYLMDAGVKIYLYTPGFNHNKCVVVDEEIAFNGTINFDYRSLVHHFECGVLLYKNPCIKDIVSDFNLTFEKCELVTKAKRFYGVGISIVNLIAPML